LDYNRLKIKSTAMSELFGRIVLERESSFLNRLKGFKVVINDAVQEKKIMNGSSEEFQVPGGTNTIVCKVNWCRSNTFSFNVKAGETVYLKVSSGMKYFWVAYAILMVLLLGRTFIKQHVNFEMNIVVIVISFAVLGYFLFYTVIRRDKYLKIEEDQNSIFAK